MVVLVIVNTMSLSAAMLTDPKSLKEHFANGNQPIWFPSDFYSLAQPAGKQTLLSLKLGLLHSVPPHPNIMLTLDCAAQGMAETH